MSWGVAGVPGLEGHPGQVQDKAGNLQGRWSGGRRAEGRTSCGCRAEGLEGRWLKGGGGGQVPGPCAVAGMALWGPPRAVSQWVTVVSGRWAGAAIHRDVTAAGTGEEGESVLSLQRAPEGDCTGAGAQSGDA